MPIAHSGQTETQEELLSRIWIYTNYDCNLSCSYCLVLVLRYGDSTFLIVKMCVVYSGFQGLISLYSPWIPGFESFQVA